MVASLQSISSMFRQSVISVPNLVYSYNFNSTTLTSGRYYVKNYVDNSNTCDIGTTNLTTLTLSNGTAYSGLSALLASDIKIPTINYVTNMGVTFTFRFMINKDFNATGTDGYLSILNLYIPAASSTTFEPYITLYTARNSAQQNYMYIPANGSSSGTARSIKALGTWCYIAVTVGINSSGTMDNKTVLMYSDVNSTNNGVDISNVSTTNIATATCTNTFTNGGTIRSNGNPSNLVINSTAQSNTGNDTSVGVIDNLRVYSKALTAAELQQDYVLVLN